MSVQLANLYSLLSSIISKLLEPRSIMSYKNRPKRAAAQNGSRFVHDEPRASTSKEEEAVDDDQDYEVDKILEKKFTAKGEVSYLVKWKGWQGEPTWEPETNCQCQGKIEEFEKSFEKRRFGKNNSKQRNSNTSLDSDSTDVDSVLINDIDVLNQQKSRSSAHIKSFRSRAGRSSIELEDKRITRNSRIK